MKVVLSWSGESSHELAKLLYDWLPQFLDGVSPWISSVDIASGRPWFNELKRALDDAEAAIVCLTPTNIHSVWLHYEAGAVVAKMDDPFVCPYLLGIEPVKVSGPLAQYQCREATKDGTLRLIRDINSAFDTPAAKHLIEGNFEAKWPAFQAALEAIEFDEDLAVDHPAHQLPELSDLAKQILVEASEDKLGQIAMLGTLDGLILQTNSQQFVKQGNARSEAKGRKAVRELEERGYVEDRSGKGIFHLTADGFTKAEELSGGDD